MNPPLQEVRHAAIACGGTGGHLFPGMAIGQCLVDAGVEVTLLVSAKEVDQRALQGDHPFEVLTLPAVGFAPTRPIRFLSAAVRSARLCRQAFGKRRPGAVLSMGGFTSAPPVWVARRSGIPAALHEANAIPGRANRWMASSVLRCFVAFEEAASRLRHHSIECVGMPVRPQFQPADPGGCRQILGLKPHRPVVLVMGGSQGAEAINRLLREAAPRIAARVPEVQFLHLTGARDEAAMRQSYQAAGLTAVVRAFLTEMELALGAATAVIARAGASSLAEFAALGVPPVLVPLPTAADDHQLANARCVESRGAATLVRQPDAAADPSRLADAVLPLLLDPAAHGRMAAALRAWHRPDAARVVAMRLARLAGWPVEELFPDHDPETASLGCLPR